MSDTNARAAEVLREYAATIEDSEINHSGPLKGRCEPQIEAEITEYRALADALSRPPEIAASPEHVCGLQGYNPMIDPPCPGCEERGKGNPSAAATAEKPRRWADDYDFDKSDPATRFFVAASNWVDRCKRAERELAEKAEIEARCCPEDVGFEEWVGVLKKRDNVVAHSHLQALVSLLLGTMKPIGPMRDRGDYPVELQRAIDFLHGRSPSATNKVVCPFCNPLPNFAAATGFGASETWTICTCGKSTKSGPVKCDRQDCPITSAADSSTKPPA